MKEKKESTQQAQQTDRQMIDLMIQNETAAADYVDEQIILAMDSLRKNCGTIQTRSFLMDMFLQHASEKKNNVRDPERLMMLQIFEIFNVA